MISRENKNLIITYITTVGVAALLVVIIFNFNAWFFPNGQLKLSDYTPASRGMISERGLHFGLLSDKKFTALQPILNQDQLNNPTTVTPNGITPTATPSARPPIEIRHGNPFSPF